MTAPLDLAPLKALAAAATPGPWEYNARRHGVIGPIFSAGDDWQGICNVTLTRGSHGPEKDNAEFIAAARTAVPALVAEVERLRAEKAAAEADLAKCLDGFGALTAAAAEAETRIKALEEAVRACLRDYSHPNFTDRGGMADRLRALLGGGS